MLRFDLYVLDTKPVYRYAINIATRKYRPLTPWLKARGLRGSFGQSQIPALHLRRERTAFYGLPDKM